MMQSWITKMLRHLLSYPIFARSVEFMRTPSLFTPKMEGSHDTSKSFLYICALTIRNSKMGSFSIDFFDPSESYIVNKHKFCGSNDFQDYFDDAKESRVKQVPKNQESKKLQ